MAKAATMGQPQYVVDKGGKKLGVILDFKAYQNLLDDIEDLKLIAERQKEPSLSLAAMRARLKKRGIL